jgi:hypothetical protein
MDEYILFGVIPVYESLSVPDIEPFYSTINLSCNLFISLLLTVAAILVLLSQLHSVSRSIRMARLFLFLSFVIADDADVADNDDVVILLLSQLHSVSHLIRMARLH